MDQMKNEKIEVSVVMPCLNEEETLSICIEKSKIYTECLMPN